jgi:O-antigen/teichoic acid export membrane protein
VTDEASRPGELDRDAPPERPHESAFRRFFVSTLGLDVVARGLSALSLVLFVRSLSTPAFAYVVLLQSVAQFVGSPVTGGIRTRYMREEAERVSRGIRDPSSFLHPVALEGALMGALAIAALAIADVFGIGDSPSQRAAFVGSAAAMGLGYAWIELVMQHHQAQLAFFRAGMIGVTRGAALMIVGVMSWAALVSDPEAVGAWLAGLMLAAGVAGVVPVLLRSWGSRSGVEGRFGFGRESAWLTVFYVISGGYAYISVFLVAGLLSEQDLASFGAASRYLAVVTGPLPALIAVLRVRAAQSDMIDSPALQADMLVRWARRTALPALGFVILFAALAPVFIPLLDDGKYPDSITIFQIMLIGAAFSYVTMPAVNLLITQRRYRALAVLYAAGFAMTCVLSVPAGLVFGVVGIAVAGALAAIFETVSAWLSSYLHARRAGGDPAAGANARARTADHSLPPSA